MLILQADSVKLGTGAIQDPPDGAPLQKFELQVRAPNHGDSATGMRQSFQSARLAAKASDIQAAVLMILAANNRELPAVQITFRSETGSNSRGWRVVLSHVIVTSVKIDEDVRFTLGYRSIVQDGG